MGLGAETIQAFIDGPYRRAEEMRVQDKRRIDAIVELHRTGMPDRVLHEAAMACGQMDVFEAVRDGGITPEEGGWFLELRRRPQSWFERLLRWASGYRLRETAQREESK